MTPEWHLQLGLPVKAVPEAAILYWQAFGSKLARVMGPDDRARQYFARAIRPEHCLAVLGSNGRLLGLAGLRGHDGGFAGGAFADLIQVYGRWGGRWRAAVLNALPRDENPARFLIDGLCVDAGYRRQGIGGQLINAAEDVARQRGFRQIQIDVAAENSSAQRLYRRLGYIETAQRPTGILRPIFGITATLTLVKDL